MTKQKDNAFPDPFEKRETAMSKSVNTKYNPDWEGLFKQNFIQDNKISGEEWEKAFYAPNNRPVERVAADMVNQPPHYTQHPSGVECIQITEHMSFTLGNAIKYIWRADMKNGIEDLQKARWYLDREIKKRSKE